VRENGARRPLGAPYRVIRTMYIDKQNGTTYTNEMLAMLQTISENFADDNAITPAIDYCDEMGYDRVKWLLQLLLKISPKKRSQAMLFTGSRRYGKVHDQSDFDWVLAYSKDSYNLAGTHHLTPYTSDTVDLADYLINYCDTRSDEYGHDWPDYEKYACPQVDMSYRFGPINLILVHRKIQFQTWKEGTTNCLALVRNHNYRVPRDVAICVINNEFQRLLHFYRPGPRRTALVTELCSCAVSLKEVL